MSEEGADVLAVSDSILDESSSAKLAVDPEGEHSLDDLHTSWSGRSRGPNPKIDRETELRTAYVPTDRYDSPLKGYYQEARHFGLLSPVEELELGRRARTGDTRAQARLVECNLRLVIKVAKRFSGRGLDFEDLVQEGNLGLIRAAQLFDPDKGARFSTYATMWIVQFISRGVDNQGRIIRLPVNVHNDMRLVSRIAFHYARRYGTEPSAEQIAEISKLSIARVKNAIENMQSALSLNQSSFGAPDSEIGERLAGSDGLETEERADEYFEHKLLNGLLSLLTQDERRAICLRYGVGAGKCLTFNEIATSEGHTVATVRRLLNSAMKKLKRHAAALRELEKGGSPVVHRKGSYSM
ncbi:MAG TPA: RNA polymerase sigma factor RpoD/SigA [Candidatus Melainabacteria bacterium]|jgi:RNA polymerase primary sigma factor|nr:RNA polymerase sigma factor RpoD/SigA [Candidatus Melainabacteria bacterium]HIN64666.1 RNA polymerase sigma factor RpoD/SigA [Candidatus Obscuribacterales bacterium]